MKVNLLEDLSKLTCTKEYVFDYLTDLSKLDICQCVLETVLSGEDADIDIGIGILNISLIDDELSFSFRPSPDLEEEIMNSVGNGKSYLQEKLESRISNRMIKLYKELI